MTHTEEINLDSHDETGENTVVDLEHADAVHAETTHEIHHEVTLAAEPIAHVGNFPITNSLLNTWLVVVIIIIFSVVLRTRMRLIPRGIQNVFEIFIEGALDMCDSVTGDRKKSKRVFPIVFTFFAFILLNNWLGILPGIGTIGFVENGTFIPYFRGGTADMNTTLALALISVIGANIFGMVSVGVLKHANKFINIKSFLDIPKKIKKDLSIIIVNPIKFFVGLIEIIGEVAKVASLSFRLFGNVFAGEVLLSTLAVIFAYGLPIPFIFLEIIVGFVQALIFALLTLVYYTIASMDEEH